MSQWSEDNSTIWPINLVNFFLIHHLSLQNDQVIYTDISLDLKNQNVAASKSETEETGGEIPYWSGEFEKGKLIEHKDKKKADKKESWGVGKMRESTLEWGTSVYLI